MANVLIVDDSRTSRRVLRDILERNGHTVLGEAVDGKEGYDLYQTLKPDIVTMDITMPVMDGIDSLKLIMRFDPQAKVIMVTAAGQKQKMMEALKIGAVEFISKPLDEEAIVKTMKELA
jgi:two-component system chemotaxis response regulator CheY